MIKHKHIENLTSPSYYCHFNVSLELSKLKVKDKTIGNQPMFFPSHLEVILFLLCGRKKARIYVLHREQTDKKQTGVNYTD